MKKSRIERQLKKDLASASPSDFAAVWKRCEKQPQTQTQVVLVEETVGGGEMPSGNKRTQILSMALAAILFVSVIFGAIFAGRNWFLPQKSQFSQGYFVLDINPSIEVDYDEDGKVTSAAGLNEDGKAVLVGITLVGKSYREATEILLQRCVAMGYFSAAREDNAVLITAMSETGEKDEKMTSAVKTSLADSFAENKVRGVVITGVSNPALQQSAQQYGIDAQKYGLILSYLALGGSLEEERYAAVSIRELYAFIQEKELEWKEAKKAESQSILQKFETELRETLSEQIGTLVDTLSVCLSTEAVAQEEKLAEIQRLIVALEEAKQQRERKKIVADILSGLDCLKDMEEDLSLLAMIESAKISISVTYDFFEKAFFQLKKVSATPEEISALRLWKFAAYGGGIECDFAAWQAEKEGVFSADWYKIKETWKADREQDI